MESGDFTTYASAAVKLNASATMEQRMDNARALADRSSEGAAAEIYVDGMDDAACKAFAAMPER